MREQDARPPANPPNPGDATAPGSRRRLRDLLLFLAAICVTAGPAGCVAGLEAQGSNQFSTDFTHRVFYAIGMSASLGIPTVCAVIAFTKGERTWGTKALLLFLWPVVLWYGIPALIVTGDNLARHGYSPTDVPVSLTVSLAVSLACAALTAGTDHGGRGELAFPKYFWPVVVVVAVVLFAMVF